MSVCLKNKGVHDNLTCLRNSLSAVLITMAYVLPIIAINMFSSRMGIRIWKRTKTIFAMEG